MEEKETMAREAVHDFVVRSRDIPIDRVTDELYKFLKERMTYAYNIGRSQGHKEFFELMHTVN